MFFNIACSADYYWISNSAFLGGTSKEKGKVVPPMVILLLF